MHDLRLVLNVIWFTFGLAVCSSWSIGRCPMLRWSSFFLCNVFGEICLLLQLESFSFAIQIHVRFASFVSWSVLFIHTVEIGILLRVLPSRSISKYWFGQTWLGSWVAAHHIQLRVFSLKSTFQDRCDAFKSHWKLRRLIFDYLKCLNNVKHFLEFPLKTRYLEKTFTAGRYRPQLTIISLDMRAASLKNGWFGRLVRQIFRILVLVFGKPEPDAPNIIFFKVHYFLTSSTLRLKFKGPRPEKKGYNPSSLA